MSPALSQPLSVNALRGEMLQGLGRLRFTQPLEDQFLEHLHSNQKGPVLFTFWITALVWMFYICLDFWRLQQLTDSTHSQAFIQFSLLGRAPVMLCLIGVLWSLHSKSTVRKHYEFFVACSFLAISTVISSSSATLKNIGMMDSSVILVLVITVAFSTLGIRFRTMLPIAVLCCVVITAAGPAMLKDPHHLQTHWVLSAAVWLNLMLSGVSAYYREKGLREQFALRQLLDWEATHDPLTGLANRRLFQEHFGIAMRQARREDASLFLVILDIDHFKLYNDHYGHSAGDAVLIEFGQLLQRYCQRPLDLAVRLGGEEFALVIYGMSSSTLVQHLQRMQAELKAKQLEHKTSPTAAYVTASMGAAAVFPLDTADQVFQRADNLLYQAKHQGRNQLCLQATAPQAHAAHLVGQYNS